MTSCLDWNSVFFSGVDSQKKRSTGCYKLWKGWHFDSDTLYGTPCILQLSTPQCTLEEKNALYVFSGKEKRQGSLYDSHKIRSEQGLATRPLTSAVNFRCNIDVQSLVLSHFVGDKGDWFWLTTGGKIMQKNREIQPSFPPPLPTYMAPHPGISMGNVFIAPIHCLKLISCIYRDLDKLKNRNISGSDDLDLKMQMGRWQTACGNNAS